MATKLNQAGLGRMERQLELLQSRAHRVKETTCVILALKADYYIVRVTHDDHHAAGDLALSPAFGPQVESVVQVDVAKRSGEITEP